MAELENIKVDPELEMLKLNKKSGFKYRERRHEDWLDNYPLYRDKVVVNRLTQRQSVNVPLMKQTVRTLLKDVDDMPVLYFENLDNDEMAEVFLNEYWKVNCAASRKVLNIAVASVFATRDGPCSFTGNNVPRLVYSTFFNKMTKLAEHRSFCFWKTLIG